MSASDDFFTCVFALIDLFMQDNQTNKTTTSNNNTIANANNALVYGSGQNIEQVLLNTILNPVHMKKTAQYLECRNGNRIPLMEVYDGARINENGYIEELHEEVFHTMDDGTSMSGYAECMNCHKIVANSNIFHCKCGKTVCILCSVKSKSGNHYCSGWHKFCAGD